MKILFFGDSITDMGRQRIDEPDGLNQPFVYGCGFPFFVAGDLYKSDPEKYFVINRGIGGDRIVDLYARVKKDVWNYKPDLVSILIGTNDVWHELTPNQPNGVEIDRWEKMYRLLIDDTKKALPNVRFIMCEPFLLHGSATDGEYEKLSKIKDYAAVAKKIAEDYGIPFVPLQKKFDEYAEKYGADKYLFDGVHPNVAGARLIADEWLKVFNSVK